jgi:hypothetical protein
MKSMRQSAQRHLCRLRYVFGRCDGRGKTKHLWPAHTQGGAATSSPKDRRVPRFCGGSAALKRAPGTAIPLAIRCPASPAASSDRAASI